MLYVNIFEAAYGKIPCSRESESEDSVPQPVERGKSSTGTESLLGFDKVGLEPTETL